MSKYKGEILAIFMLCFLIISTSCSSNISKKDLKEIYSDNLEYKNFYNSERGFGNDRFDIYYFSFKNGKNDKILKDVDKIYLEKLIHSSTLLGEMYIDLANSNRFEDSKKFQEF